MEYPDYANIINAVYLDMVNQSRIHHNHAYTGKLINEVLDMIENAMNHEIERQYSQFGQELVALPRVRYSNAAGGKYIVS